MIKIKVCQCKVEKKSVAIQSLEASCDSLEWIEVHVGILIQNKYRDLYWLDSVLFWIWGTSGVCSNILIGVV